eukprot:ctg_1683.g521
MWIGRRLAASSGPASAAAPRECSPCLTRSAESRRLGSPAGKPLRERSPESYSTMPLSPRARVLSRTRQLHNHMEPHDPRLRARSLYGSDTGARLVSAEAPSEHAVGRAASVVPRWESSSPTDHRTGDPAGHSARATAATDTSSSSTSGGESDWDADDSAIGEAPSATTGSQVDAFTVPRTLFAQSGGLFSRTEADTIPGFFRMVDRARLSYRGRIIVRYPKPSVLVYSKMPETGKNQFSEKELERWLVQFVACAPNAERDKEEVPDDAVALSEEAGRPLTAARIEATARACTRLYRSAAYPAVLRGILRLLSDPAAIVDLLTAASTGGEPETSRRTFSMLLHLIRLLRRLLRHFPVETALYRRTCEALSALTRQFSSAGCPAFSDALRCELAELLIHYGADAFGMPPPVLERQVLQLLERVLRNRPQWPRSVGGVGHNAAGATTTATTSASECRSLHLYVRALFILFACLNELTPADWQPGRHDALEADAVTAFIEDMLMRRQPPAAETATGATGWLVEHLRTACLPQLPKWCWARSRCSLVLGTWASAHGDFATAESHLFEALYVLSRCDECEAAGSPRTIELSEAALTAYADTLLRNDKYRFAIAALRAAANAYEAREGQPPHLLLQRMREVALSQQDYVRAAQAGFALLSTACHCGRSIEALHLTAQLARIMTDAGWFMRAESLLAAVWHAFDACAAEDGAAAAATTDALEGRSSGGCNGPSRHAPLRTADAAGRSALAHRPAAGGAAAAAKTAAGAAAVERGHRAPQDGRGVVAAGRSRPMPGGVCSIHGHRRGGGGRPCRRRLSPQRQQRQHRELVHLAQCAVAIARPARDRHPGAAVRRPPTRSAARGRPRHRVYLCAATAQPGAPGAFARHGAVRVDAGGRPGRRGQCDGAAAVAAALPAGVAAQDPRPAADGRAADLQCGRR